MPFTRQRPDGTNDALRINTYSTYFSPSTVRSLALTAAVCGLLSQSSFAKPAGAKPLSGVWGWTSGSQTYLRARPSAQTPPVAKVGRHTKLYVWGKFNGWYRVETTDHVFGWVYYDYISAPESDKLANLSHKKARLASDRTAHQTMYGSKQMLASYYEKYKAPGAARGLKKQGLSLNGTRLARSPKSSPRISSTRIARNSTQARATLSNARLATTSIKRIPGSDRYARPDERFVNASDPSFNDVGNVRLAPAALASTNTLATTRDDSSRNDSSRDEAARLAALRQVAANAEAARLEKVEARRRADAQRTDAQRTIKLQRSAQARRDAEAQRSAEARQAQAQRVAAQQRAAQAQQQQAAAKRLAEAKRAADAKRLAEAKRKAQTNRAAAATAAHQARVAKWQREKQIRQARVAARAAARQQKLVARRNNLRDRMGEVRMAQPPSSVAGMRPISPDELMRARDAYLEGQRKSTPTRSGGNVATMSDQDDRLFAPSSWNATSGQELNQAQELDEASWNEGWNTTPVRSAAWNSAGWNGTDAPQFTLVVNSADAAAAGAFLPNFPAQPASNSGAITRRSAQFTAPQATAKIQPKSFNVGLVRVAATKRAAVKTASSPRAAATRGGSPRDRFAAMPNTFGDGLASQALSYRGMPYISGAASPRRGFDCSGLVYFMLRQRGLKPPRTAAGLATYGHKVSRGEMKAGDMVFFANTYKRGISHIGIYIGNGKFVHAATSRTGVRVDSLASAYYRKKWHSARRVS